MNMGDHSCFCSFALVFLAMGVSTLGFELGWWPDESCTVCPPDFFAAETMHLCLHQTKGIFIYDQTTGINTLVYAECPAGFVVAKDSYTCGSSSSEYRCLDYKNTTTAIGKIVCEETVNTFRAVAVLFGWLVLLLILIALCACCCGPVQKPTVVQAEVVEETEDTGLRADTKARASV